MPGGPAGAGGRNLTSIASASSRRASAGKRHCSLSGMPKVPRAGMDLGLTVGACVAAAGCLVALLTLPSREPPDGE